MNYHTAFIAWFWAGLIVGVNFIATPAKFLAPTITLAEALDVGRATFGVFKWVEVVALVALLWTSRESLSRALPAGLVSVLALILVINYVGLLPLLDARVDLVLRGESVPHSSMHLIYVLLDLVKVVVLLTLGIVLGRSFPVKNAELKELI